MASSTITATPKSVRPHIMMCEIEEESGYRHWSKPMVPAQLNPWVWQQTRFGAGVSDYCCASTCWCAEDDDWQ